MVGIRGLHCRVDCDSVAHFDASVEGYRLGDHPGNDVGRIRGWFKLAVLCVATRPAATRPLRNNSELPDCVDVAEMQRRNKAARTGDGCFELPALAVLK